MAVFLLGGRAAEQPGRISAYRNRRLAVDISIDRYKLPLEKAVIIKLDYSVDRGAPGLSSRANATLTATNHVVSASCRALFGTPEEGAIGSRTSDNSVVPPPNRKTAITLRNHL